MSEKRIILGVPYVFSRNKLRKPFHREVVTISARGVLCHNGCGLYYVAPTDETMQPGDVCPDCNQPPKPWTLASEPEDLEVAVNMQFGNVMDVELIRALGPNPQRRQVGLPMSLALVKPQGSM